MNLDALLAPRSVAVVGASDDPARVGGLVLGNLMKGFAGTVAPINPNRTTVQGLPAHPSISALAAAPDLAVIVSPPAAVADTARECAQAGVGAMIVITSGFAEIGPEGAVLQEELAEIARDNDIAMLGPNCVGVLNLPLSMRASFVRLTGIPMRQGPVAVVSQSGAVGLALFEYAQERGVGANYLCTTGNEATLSCADLIADLIERPEVEVVMAYLEGIRDPGVLLRAGERALELGKPIVALKVGGSGSGGRAAASHTGSLAVPDRIIDAALDAAGIVRARSMRQLLDLTKGFTAGRVPQGRRVVVFTGSGGVGVTMADATEAAGLDLAAPSPALEHRLRALVPPVGSVANPIDHTAQIVNQPEKYEALVRAVLTTDEYDSIVVANVSRTQMPRIVDLLSELSAGNPATIVAQSHYAEIAEQLNQRGIPAVDDPAAAIELVAAMAGWQERRRRRGDRVSRTFPAPGTRSGRPLGAHESAELLERYGVCFPRSEVVDGEQAAAAAFARSPRPVALKIDADWMTHKSEHGGVILDCRSELETRVAYKRLRAIADRLAPAGAATRIVVQQMAEPGLELVCGAVRDATFGPVVSIGLGGVLVELIDQTELVLAPVTLDTALDVLTRLGRGRLVGHPRGLTPLQAESVADLMVAVSNVMISEPGVLEIDLNPITVGAGQICAVDALVVLAADAEPPGEHADRPVAVVADR